MTFIMYLTILIVANVRSIPIIIIKISSAVSIGNSQFSLYAYVTISVIPFVATSGKPSEFGNLLNKKCHMLL